MKNPILYLLAVLTTGGCVGGSCVQSFGRYRLRPIPDANQSYSATMTRLGHTPQDLGCVASGAPPVFATTAGGTSVTFQFKVFDNPSCSGEPCSTAEVTRIAQSGETIDVTPPGCLGE
ncbi:MAG: hypothetical protein K1X67_03870 [Fimbriimonadaceae bacterium]|nr:hypothetical protein [Fimbriimonadaceae bacterium]